MSIHFISGKPGGGKSMYAVKMIVDELLYGDRCVITNVPLKLGELNAYLQREYPTKSIDLHKRVRLFDEEEMKGFFTIRPLGSVGPKLLTKEEWQQGKQPDYSGVTDHGVAYFVDEVHIGFNARSWMETGRDVLYYLSQHRKLGDTVVCITQAIMNVDKQFRSVTQDYTYLRNLTKEKMGMFKLPSMFIRQTFNTPAGDNSKPMETGTFRLDVKGLAACYDTAKGVGIHGRANADMKERRKGLPWYYAVAAILIFIYFMSQVAPKVIAGIFSPKLETLETNKVKPLETKGPALFQVTNPPPVAAGLPEPEPEPEPEPITVVGYHRLNGPFEVWLSDGRYLKQGRDLDLEAIHPERGVKVSGEWLKFAKASPVASSSGGGVMPLPTAEFNIAPRPKRAVVTPGETWRNYP